MAQIIVASDHGGFRLKTELVAQLRSAGHEVEDIGTDGQERSDYPDVAHAVAGSILAGRSERGILVCGTGVGMAIAANRHSGIRAVVTSDTYTARLSRSHNDTNILCLGERVVGNGLAWDIVAAWLAEATSRDDRHVLRRKKIEI